MRLPGSKKKVKVSVPKPIGFSVPPASVTSNSVTLTLAGKPGKQKFSKGGEITVNNVDNSAGVFLAREGVLIISAGGKSIAEQS